MESKQDKWYLGWTDFGLSGSREGKVPCLCRGVIGVNIDVEYAKKLQLTETTKEEYRKAIREFDEYQRR